MVTEEVDGDLKRDNRRRWRVSTYLFIGGSLMMMLAAAIRTAGPVKQVLLWISG
jgi:hypothetical protein